MARKLQVNTSQTSSAELLGIAGKCGFVIFHGAKHDKVKTSQGKFISEIPRHSTIYKPIAKKIVAAMNKHGASITFT